MAGMFGYSPYEGIRLGKEVAELVRDSVPDEEISNALKE